MSDHTTGSLLEVHDLEIEGLEQSKKSLTFNVQVEGSSLACEGQAGCIIDAIFDNRLIHRGTISLGGTPINACLLSGQAGLVPAHLPAPDSAQVRKILLMSARLIGHGAHEVDAALDRCGISHLHKRHLKGLSLQEHRLVALAHGITGEPPLLVLAQIFHHLSREESLQLMNVLRPALKNRRWIAKTRFDVAASLDLTLLAEQMLTVQTSTQHGHETQDQSQGALHLTASPNFAPEAYWVRSQDPLDRLAESLESQGVLVTPGPNQFALLVCHPRAQDIFAQAHALGLGLIEMSPAQSDRFGLSRARSDA